ncbi:ABC transporter family substrate-binding protein [Gordonia sp. ABSL1-1]|uniref:ABC transporter family substrate-binding protein n=1 Tax=Gordonia sp. ABSL1-1 TaxID=3053923 RepID=UPI00257365F9|nr:ABC transporter family substrate-binding protein [Gordonia sp. ABSL1-1]MDL9935683.1 ABC transporter family substrate-binding protein [Gordonia sp. ABSL1-1]
MSDPPPPVRDTGPIPTPTEYPTEKSVYIATDSVGSGFNPHIASDQSPVTTAIAAMTLPSAFAPVSTPTGVQWQLQRDFVTSAEVTSEKPFTVTYHIHTDAQWSDGLPVTGDDFSYLWQQMSRQPNVVAPAGYRLIDSVQSREGGKTVLVTFAERYPAWRELFSGLLPSHVLKGAPAGFQTGMDTGKPVSAGPFAIVAIDSTRDEVRLTRNDRYWMTPSKLDQIVLRRAGTTAQMLDSVRSGDSSIAMLGGGASLQSVLSSVPGMSVRRDLNARSLGVSVNARTPVMADINVRRAVLGLIDARVVTFAATGDWIVEPYANTVFAPSDRGYTPVNRPRPSREQVAGYLRDAGYVPGAPTPVGQQADPNVPTLPVGVAPLQRNGADLAVRVGAVSGDVRATSAAAAIVDQLRAGGIRAQVVTMPNSELYGAALTRQKVDVIVGWSGLGVPPAASLASQVDCDQPKPGTEPSLSTPPTPTSVAPSDSDAATSYASNISGLCDARLIELARRALSADDPMPALNAAEPLLAAQFSYIPLYQDSMLVGVDRPAVVGVPDTGPIQVSIFGSAGTWDLPQ